MLLQVFSITNSDEQPAAFVGYVQLPDGLPPAEILIEACDQMGVDTDLEIDQDPETGVYTLSRGRQFLYSLEEVLLDST